MGSSYAFSSVRFLQALLLVVGNGGVSIMLEPCAMALTAQLSRNETMSDSCNQSPLRVMPASLTLFARLAGTSTTRSTRLRVDSCVAQL